METAKQIVWFGGLCTVSAVFMSLPVLTILLHQRIMGWLFGSQAPVGFHLGTGELHVHEESSGVGLDRPHPSFPRQHGGRTVLGELGDAGDPVRLYLRLQLRTELPCQMALQRGSRTLYMFQNLPRGSVARRARACLPSGGPAPVSAEIDARFITRASAWPPACWLLRAVSSSLLAFPPTVTDVIGGGDRLLVGMEVEPSPEELQSVVEHACRLADHVEHALTVGSADPRGTVDR